MVVERYLGYSSLNKMIVDYDESLKFLLKEGTEILAQPSDVEETNITFISHEYSLGVYVTSSKINLFEFGTKFLDKVPFKFLELNETSGLEYDEKTIRVFFKDGYKVKELVLDLLDLGESYEVLP